MLRILCTIKCDGVELFLNISKLLIICFLLLYTLFLSPLYYYIGSFRNQVESGSGFLIFNRIRHISNGSNRIRNTDLLFLNFRRSNRHYVSSVLAE